MSISLLKYEFPMHESGYTCRSFHLMPTPSSSSLINTASGPLSLLIINRTLIPNFHHFSVTKWCLIHYQLELTNGVWITTIYSSQITTNYSIIIMSSVHYFTAVSSLFWSFQLSVLKHHHQRHSTISSYSHHLLPYHYIYHKLIIPFSIPSLLS